MRRFAGATADAQYLAFTSFDHVYRESCDVQGAVHPQAIVACGMHDALLGPAYGARPV